MWVFYDLLLVFIHMLHGLSKVAFEGDRYEDSPTKNLIGSVSNFDMAICDTLGNLVILFF